MTDTTAGVPVSRPRTTLSRWTDWGKWLALISMTVDHVVRYALSNELSWQFGWASSTIGRVAFPLFAAMVAWHGLFDTRNPMRYARRILIIGLIAQLPYMLMPRYSSVLVINVCFTLAFGLVWGAWLRQLLTSPPRETRARMISAAAVALSIIVWYKVGPLLEYGRFGILMVPGFMLAMAVYQHFDHGVARIWAWLAGVPILLITAQLNIYTISKSVAFSTTLVVLVIAAGLARWIPGVVRMPRWLWLGWYPGHLAVIALIVYLPYLLPT